MENQNQENLKNRNLKNSLVKQTIIPEFKEKMLELKLAFPVLTKDFMQLLGKRLIANRFTPDRFERAVDNLIDNYKFQQPTIADIITFEKDKEKRLPYVLDLPK